MPITYCPGCNTTVRRLLNAVPGMLCPSCLEHGDHVPLRFAPFDTERAPHPWSSGTSRRELREVPAGAVGSRRSFAGGGDG